MILNGHFLPGLFLAMISGGLLMAVLAYLRKRIAGPNQMYVEEDGWQEGNNIYVPFTHRRLVIFIGGIILTISGLVLIVTVGNARFMHRSISGFSQLWGKVACSNIMTGVSSAQTQNGHLPSYLELADFLDQSVYDCMCVPGSKSKSESGYKGYQFLYLESSDGVNPDPDVRAVVVYPIIYGKSGKNVYYRTSETGLTFQAYMKDVEIPTQIIYNKDLPSAVWKTGK